MFILICRLDEVINYLSEEYITTHIMSMYHIGMYGGKFIPFHAGHRYCLATATKECDMVYCIMFINGSDESKIEMTDSQKEIRISLFWSNVSRFDNAIPAIIDVSGCRCKDGGEDWDMETPLVRDVVGDRLDAVYSSEPSYGKYFQRAYPEAEHRLVDPQRIHNPISGTLIRSVWDKDSDWMRYL